MKKALIILLLVTVILALWSFDNSFLVSSDYGSVSGTSAVVFAKADYVSVKATFNITPKAGTWANVTFSNGTQVSIAWTKSFVIFFPKTGNQEGYYTQNAPGGLLLITQKPFGTAVVSNTTESYFDTLNSYSNDNAPIYWLRIDGAAQVRVYGYGVTV